MNLVRQFLLTSIHLAGHFGETRGQIFNEADQVFERIDDLSDSEIIKDAFTLGDDFANFRLIKAQEEGGGALKNSAINT